MYMQNWDSAISATAMDMLRFSGKGGEDTPSAVKPQQSRAGRITINSDPRPTDSSPTRFHMMPGGQSHVFPNTIRRHLGHPHRFCLNLQTSPFFLVASNPGSSRGSHVCWSRSIEAQCPLSREASLLATNRTKDGEEHATSTEVSGGRGDGDGGFSDCTSSAARSSTTIPGDFAREGKRHTLVLSRFECPKIS